MQQHGETVFVLVDRIPLTLLQLVRWQIVTAVDIVVEILLVCLAAYLVQGLKMSLSRKAMVVVAFCFRLPYAHVLPSLLIVHVH